MKRNVLFILVDCLRADKCLEEKTSYTPTIDCLRKEGTTFLNTISVTSTTTPNVASILTGVYPFVHDIRSHYGSKLNSNCPILGEIFKENGYTTYAEVTGPLWPETGLNRGFDYYHHRDWKAHLYTKWGDSLIQRFKTKKFNEPWFLFVHFWALHYPRRLLNEFNNNKFGKNRYERALSCLDFQLRKLLTCIDRENTLIILHGDHGEKIAQTMTREYINDFKGFLGKRIPCRLFNVETHAFHIYDYLIRVPLIFVGNPFPKNRMITDQVRQIDIFPTIIDAFKLKTNRDGEIHGRSLLPLIINRKVKEEPAYCEAIWHGKLDKKRLLRGIRTSGYKYVYAPYNKDIPEELYDLKNDPDEKENILKKRKELAKKLRQKILQIRSRTSRRQKPIKMSKEEEEIIRERLKELGYI